LTASRAVLTLKAMLGRRDDAEKFFVLHCCSLSGINDGASGFAEMPRTKRHLAL